MKHPSFKELQDYFECESSDDLSSRIKKHIETCDKCSQVLSEMAKVDVLFSKQDEVEVSSEVKEVIFSKAHLMLKKKRDSIQANVNKKEKRKEKVTEAISILESLKEGALAEFKMPALQTAAIGLFLVVLTKVATTETYIEYNQIISDDVQVVSSELLGEDNEIY